MNEMNISKFKTELENRLDKAESHTEKYDYLEAVKHTLTFLNVENEHLDQMLYELQEQAEKEHKVEYGI